MPSNSRRQYQTVVVKPEWSESKSYTAPDAAPSPRRTPKAVHFDDDTVVKADARDATLAEKWSLYNFERHATRCPECYNPLHVYQREENLCPTGHAMAQDVDMHVFRQDGYVYSTTKDNHKLVPIKFPNGYVQTAQLLRALEWIRKKSKRLPPRIIHEKTYPVTERRGVQGDEYDYQKDRREPIILEPASSDGYRSSRRTSARSRPEGYGVVIDEGVETSASRPAVPRERRGSLYYEDLKCKRTEKYRVEIREPERHGSRRERHISGFWA